MSVLEYEYYSSMRDSAPGPNLISICDMLSALLVFVLVIVDSNPIGVFALRLRLLFFGKEALYNSLNIYMNNLFIKLIL